MATVQILVVEDNADDARMTLRAIGKLVPHVSSMLVRDGEEALDLLSGETRCIPELIILDLKMPKIHGFEVLRALRENPEYRTVPVVIFTSSNDPGDISRARSLGANGFICKPIGWDEYAALIAETAATYLCSKALGV